MAPVTDTSPDFEVRDLADQSDQALEHRDEAVAAIAKLVPLSEGCPGSVAGNLALTNPGAVLLSKVASVYSGWGSRERSCPNPGFRAVQQDSDVHVQGALQYGNWIGKQADA